MQVYCCAKNGGREGGPLCRSFQALVEEHTQSAMCLISMLSMLYSVSSFPGKALHTFHLVIFDVLPLCKIDRLVRAPKRKVCCMLQKQCWVPLTRRHGAKVCAWLQDPQEAFASAKGVHRECRDDSGLHTPENSPPKN